MKRLFILPVLLFLLTGILFAQEGEKPKKWELTGYLKGLQALYGFNESYPDLSSGKLDFVDTFLVDNLIHNRLNFWWFMNDQLTFKADLRTRAFYGDLVRATPDFGEVVDDANNDFFDLSLVLIDNSSFVVQTMLDRLYLEYVKNDWEIRVGRQRVNWGISTVWNPNDIFNAFDFTDFDYEERPGSDALRIKRYLGFASSVEVVSKAFRTWDEAVMAGMWKFNKWSYDVQLLAYTFTNALYLNLGYLYNSNGRTDVSSGQLFVFQLSAKNLYPYRHSLFISAMYPLTPLINTSLAVIYSPVEVHPVFLNPTFTFSIAQNWDIDLVGQISFNKEPDRGYVSPVQAGFARIKWSF